MQVTLLQQQISAAESDNSNLQLELTSVKEELAGAQQDVKRYSEDATQTQELYQHELMQHSKSVQSLVEIKEKVCTSISIKFLPIKYIMYWDREIWRFFRQEQCAYIIVISSLYFRLYGMHNSPLLVHSLASAMHRHVSASLLSKECEIYTV